MKSLSTASVHLFVFLSEQKCQVSDDQHDYGIYEQAHHIEPGVVPQEVQFFKILIAV